MQNNINESDANTDDDFWVSLCGKKETKMTWKRLQFTTILSVDEDFHIPNE